MNKDKSLVTNLMLCFLINPTLVMWDFQTWLVMWGVCAPQYKKVYRVNHTTFSLVQDIFTNTIKHFDICVTRFMEIIHNRCPIWEFKTKLFNTQSG